MSSTGRGTVRNENDDYPTPKWCVHRLLEAVALPPGIWVEPCAGAGNIFEAVEEICPKKISWLANEINPKYEPELRKLKKKNLRFNFTIGDALQRPYESDFRVIITNPPFSIAEELLRHFFRFKQPYTTVVFLQRLNWCAGPRAALFRELKPSVYVLPNRPSFTGKGVDSTEYAWFLFDGKGQFHILKDTPKEVRAAEAAHARTVYQKRKKKIKKPEPVLGRTRGGTWIP